MNKYLNPKNYARRALVLANRHVLNRIEPSLAPRPDVPLRHPPIFFLGAPRCGSTLMIQVITVALDLGYISNRHCEWYGAPAVAERLFHTARSRRSSDYTSFHGATTGLHAPAECGEWWYRFFRRRPAYVTLQEADSAKMRRFRQSIAALTNAFDRPVLFKNLYASLRIQAIAQYLPESLFIVTHRNEIDNGHSLLEARYKAFKSYERWWSMEPPNVGALKILPAHQQVIEQIRHIYATIARDLQIANVADSRRLALYYEEFCANPRDKIDGLVAFLASHNCVVERRGAVPSEFKRREEVRIDRALFAAMVGYAQGS